MNIETTTSTALLSSFFKRFHELLYTDNDTLLKAIFAAAVSSRIGPPVRLMITTRKKAARILLAPMLEIFSGVDENLGICLNQSQLRIGISIRYLAIITCQKTNIGNFIDVPFISDDMSGMADRLADNRYLLRELSDAAKEVVDSLCLYVITANATRDSVTDDDTYADANAVLPDVLNEIFKYNPNISLLRLLFGQSFN